MRFPGQAGGTGAGPGDVRILAARGPVAEGQSFALRRGVRQRRLELQHAGRPSRSRRHGHSVGHLHSRDARPLLQEAVSAEASEEIALLAHAAGQGLPRCVRRAVYVRRGEDSGAAVVLAIQRARGGCSLWHVRPELRHSGGQRGVSGAMAGVAWEATGDFSWADSSEKRDRHPDRGLCRHACERCGVAPGDCGARPDRMAGRT